MPKRRGRPPKHEEALTPFAARLPPTLHAQLKEFSDERGESMNDLVIRAVQQWLNRVTSQRAKG